MNTKKPEPVWEGKVTGCSRKLCNILWATENLQHSTLDRTKESFFLVICMVIIECLVVKKAPYDSQYDIWGFDSSGG